MNQAEEELFNVIRQHPKGAGEEQLLRDLPDLSKDDIVPLVNGLSEKGYVDFVTVGKQLLFKARDINEANKTRDLSQNEKIVYNFIKSEKGKGIWIKDIKAKSGLHQQVVNDAIKTLEKFRLIRSVKSVKTPTRKLYIVFDQQLDPEHIGGPWFVENELDVPFIEGLTEMTFKFISTKSYPKLSAVTQQQIAAEGRDAKQVLAQQLYPPDHTGYATPRDILVFLKRSGILKVDLSLADIQMLVDRLWFDGKVSRIRRFGGGAGGSSSMDEDDGDGDGEEVVEMWMYKAVRGESVPGVYWSDVPCGRCAVSGFCKSGGPVSPEGCLYFNKWLEF